MSRKSCKRKHWARVNPIELAISGATITSEVDLDKLRLRELAALEQFARHKAQPSDFRDLCDMLNLAETMAGMGIGPEVLPVCQRVEELLMSAKGEFEATGMMSASADELTDLRDLYAYHDLQRTSVDRSQYERAIVKTRNRIRSSHPDSKVIV